MNDQLRHKINSVPPGDWAVGVSGGADSVGLLCLLKGRVDLSLRVVHLDHQTRQGESAADARFVRQLAEKLSLPCDLSTLAEVESATPIRQSNRSARFRAARFAWFRTIAEQHHLQGVILAHHAADQAETILLRLLRGSGYRGLAGMARRSTVGGLVIVRPLLEVPKEMLVQHLQSIGQNWREDSSNTSPIYARNRVRRMLTNHPALSSALTDLGKSCRALRNWTNCAPRLEEQFAATHLANLPSIFARESVRRWFVDRGVPAGKLSPAVLDRGITMATDAASPPRMQCPGGVTIRRRGGIISIA